MSTAYGPVLPRRRIATEVKALREKAHLRLDEVARETDVSTSTLSRIENAQGSPNALTIRALVDFYDLGGTELGTRLIKWARDGRQQGWWSNFSEAATEHTNLYVAYEGEAAVVKLYAIPFVPVLLHTDAYSEALARAFHPQYTDDQIKQIVRFRQKRQATLTHREDQAPLELKAILHPTCLTQLVGSPAVMRDQLRALMRTAQELLETVDLRILRESAPAHPAMVCAWSHFEYSYAIDDDVVHAETHVGLRNIEAQDQVKESARHFSELTQLSRNQEDSVACIQEVLDARYA